MLTGSEIIKEVNNERIYIENFDPNCVGPNSYDLHWGNTCKTVLPNDAMEDPATLDHRRIIDMKKEQIMGYRKIGENGLILEPNTLYLIPTLETVGSEYYVPRIVGRSSIGRMGISISQHADFGDIGFIGKWTMQVTVTYPTRIYPNLRVAQVYFEEVKGETQIKYHGRYQNAEDAIASKFIDPDF